MSIPSDFVRYDIKLGGGLSGVVYFGANPSVSDTALKKEFEDCIEGSQVCSFVSLSKPLSTVEAIYSGDRQHDFVHVVLIGVSESNKTFSLEFLENFRACERVSSSLQCQDNGIFSAPEREEPAQDVERRYIRGVEAQEKPDKPVEP